MSNRLRIVSQSLASHNMESSRRFSTHLEIKCPSQRDIGKTVGIDKWTGRGGAKISIDELKRCLQQSRCNDSEPLMQKQKEQTLSIPPKKSKKGLRDGLSWEPDKSATSGVQCGQLLSEDIQETLVLSPWRCWTDLESCSLLPFNWMGPNVLVPSQHKPEKNTAKDNQLHVMKSSKRPAHLPSPTSQLDVSNNN